MWEQQAHTGVRLIDLASLAAAADGNGPQWSHESDDLDLTLLSWTERRSIETHVNDEVDVVLIALVGAGEVTVDGEVYPLAAGQALLIPKGAQRALRCVTERWSYLSLHRRRRGLWPSVRSADAR